MSGQDTSGQDTSSRVPILLTDCGDQQPIAVLRSQIDAVDDTIIRLIVERAEMSSRITVMRSANGNTGVDLGGEYRTIAKFHDALGRNGSVMASLLLRSRRLAR